MKERMIIIANTRRNKEMEKKLNLKTRKIKCNLCDKDAWTTDTEVPFPERINSKNMIKDMTKKMKSIPKDGIHIYVCLRCFSHLGMMFVTLKEKAKNYHEK